MRLEVCLQKSFGSFRFDAEFRVEVSRIGIFGKSGSGKSTLVGMLAGLVHPDAGYIRLDGEPLYDSATGVRLSPERRRLAVVFQHAHLFPHLSVQRNLLYGYRRTPGHERKIDPGAIAEVLNITHLLGRGVGTLSGGERQRVALGRAVLTCPRFILMDEPLTGLDEGLKYQIIPYLQKVFSEFDIPLLFISHSLNEMRLMTEEVLVFEAGRLAAQVSVEDLARQRMASSQVGYINLMELHSPRPQDDLWAYRWGEHELVLSDGANGGGAAMYELSSKDITLFKRHPEASSARNLLHCRVTEVFETGNRVGVELDCGGQRLVSQVVHDAARDLEIRRGAELYAIIKASAFRRLY
ncbi:molybdate-transporting ATPase [Desulfuromonas versatilis]|uniref:Molybdate-transporting ATPase n=1 Tax=Desulfuromonas versatilis TaxID=2802975 RepID=A0ABM8HX61_9BACT|nr:molybdenum ABC transporter ATP-binding protein [Desulfuromonas versatilis]BCR06533.1 molybdate-transporting ATPase [Desulfuromonas versatilis]